MKLFTGWVVSAALVFTAAAANAQVLAPYETGRSPYTAASDFGGPDAGMPAPRYGYGPTLLPPQEVYTVVRESGFSPLGIPQLRGLVYTISVIDRGGDDGRLVIDARTGRVIRFMPAWRMGDNFNAAVTTTYGPVGPPPVANARGTPRPPASVPRVASHTVPMPKAAPPRPAEPKPLAAAPAPEPAQQSAAVQAKPADAPPPPPAAASTVGQAKPAAAELQPTQDMPKAQGLE